MKNYRHFEKKKQTRLSRVERKCDRILAELLIIRQTIIHRPDIDTAIDRLHKTARKMRAQCARERDSVIRLFNPIPHGDDC